MKGSILSPRHLPLVIIALVSHGVGAAEIRRKDGVHRAAKVDAVVTQAPHLVRRDHTACPTGYNLCAADFDGGCCGDGYKCAVESCYATTQGPVTCAGRVGYHACGVEFGGGCCPVGSICERGSRCIPAPGVSYSHECNSNSHLCPASLGYGCCGDGLACGQNRCFSTEPSTMVFTKTMTTTDADDTLTTTTTVTTVSTPSADSETGDVPANDSLYKFYPTAVPKVEPLVTETESESGGGGLTSGQIGGAVAGAILFLIIVVVAAIFVIRRLNHVAKAVDDAKPEPDDRRESTRDHQYPAKTADAEVDSISTSASPWSRYRSGTTVSDFEPPSLFSTPSPGLSGQSSRRDSHRLSATSPVKSLYSWTRSNRHSDWSASSYAQNSDVVITPVSPEPAELEARNGPTELPVEESRAELSGGESRAELSGGESRAELGGGESRAELNGSEVAVAAPVAVAVAGPGKVAARASKGDGNAQGHGHGHKRSLSAAPQLDVVSEDGETIHGYYGPLDRVAGQTVVGTPALTEEQEEGEK